MFVCQFYYLIQKKLVVVNNMITLNLKIFLYVVNFVYFLIILFAVKKDRMPIKSSIIWFLIGIFMFIFISFPDILVDVASLVGIETISNLVLFTGVMCLLVLSFDLYKIINIEKKKNISLSQEIGIIKNELRKKK